MQPQPTAAPFAVRPFGVLVVDGYGIRVFVERGQLVVHDGIGRSRRQGRFARATCPVRRLVLLGHTGFISLDALRWLTDVGVGLVQLDPDGRLLMASGGLGLDDPRLRRAQALSWGSEAGMAAAVDLLDAKLRGQTRVVSHLSRGDPAAATIESCRLLLRLATTPAELMVPEAAAASAYWAVWSGVELRWARKDQLRVPNHWRTFGGRASPLTGNPRSAANPANAILNYLYSLAEAEARLACLAMGLDPGLGALHADLRARDSLALDVMEAIRPDVDAWFLGLVERRTFRWADFVERRDGSVRLLSPLTHELAETIVLWRARLGPIVEGVARAFAAGPNSRVQRLPTLLTGDRKSAGRDGQRRSDRRPATRMVMSRTCSACGGSVHPGRGYCDVCLPEVIGEQRAAFLLEGQAELRRQRDAGADRSHGGEAGRSRAIKVAESRRAAAEWERSNGPADDQQVFRHEVLPSLAGVTASELSTKSGLSRPYCAAILRGERTPHPRWWRKLKDC